MKIAIHLPGGLGDEVCLTPTYRALKEKYSNCEITAHVSHPEILLMNPYVDHLSNCNRNFYFNRKMYDKYIYMFWQANKRQCFSYMHLCDWFASQADVKLKDRSLIFNLGDSDREFLNSYNFPKNRPIISFDAYGNKEPNKWSFKNFITTIDYLHEKYNAFVVQIGLQDYSIRNADLNLVRKLNIRQLAAMIERSDLYIGNDSGAAHIASAVKTTSIKIFGCTDPACYTHNKNEYPVVSDIECQGCQNKKPCNNPIHKKSVECPNEKFGCIKIPVEKVFKKIDIVLGGLKQISKLVDEFGNSGQSGGSTPY